MASAIEKVYVNSAGERAICRSCSLQKPKEKVKQLKSLLEFDTTIFEIPFKVSVANLYNYCTKLEAKIGDSLPQNVCTDCIKKLICIYEFLKACEKAIKKFKNDAQKYNNMFECTDGESTDVNM
jgi:Zinc-finger associated domain (zf-AD)